MDIPVRATGSHPTVFLDRDGVLNRRKWNLVRRLDELILLPGAAEAAAALSRSGYKIVLATNQEFVGHGYIKMADHEEVMQHIVDEIRRAGGRVDGVYACLHPRGSDCHDQKPKPGMLLDAARDLDLDLRASFMVGDNRKDMGAGRAAGTRTILVDPRFRTWMQNATELADHVARDLPSAAAWILGQRTLRPTVPAAPPAAPVAPAPDVRRLVPGEPSTQAPASSPSEELAPRAARTF